MQTHRVLHDFRELTREDIGEVFTEIKPTFLQKKPYQFLIAALAIGFFVSYLARRK